MRNESGHCGKQGLIHVLRSLGLEVDGGPQHCTGIKRCCWFLNEASLCHPRPSQLSSGPALNPREAVGERIFSVAKAEGLALP